MQKYLIAIVGAGPAGLSAAGRAAELDREKSRTTPSYILLDGFGQLAKTIQRYQKGKLVMDEPGYLDVRSDLRFAAGTREEVLGRWGEDLRRLTLNCRFNSQVRSIAGQRGDFRLTLGDGTVEAAEHVVLAIGIEGNPRKVGAPGDDLEGVQYQLDDPREYSDERILVVGAGDSAIENALALAEQNDVWIINRGTEFGRPKEANLRAVLKAINDPNGRLRCYYQTRISGIVRTADKPQPLAVRLQTPTGEQVLECNRVIARLGADPPRRFVEATGVKFPSERREALPALSKTYESNVAGLYIIGSLAGYPLIKQAMNQGYDVVEFINGNDIKPADYALLERQFHGLASEREPDASLDRFQNIVPMFRELNALAFRELIVESEIVVAYPGGAEFEEAGERMDKLRAADKPGARARRATRIVREGDVIYEPGEFGTSFYTIVSGSVTVQPVEAASTPRELRRGEFFGETSLLSGRPRTERVVAGAGCVLVETPRRTMIKLMSSNEDLRAGIDWIFVVRELQRHFAPNADPRDLRDIAGRVELRQYRPGETLFVEGTVAESLFALRSGNVSLSRNLPGGPLQVAQLAAGQLIGEMGLMGDPVRRETATATVACEALELGRAEFIALCRRQDARLQALRVEAARRAKDIARMAVQPEAGSVMGFLMDEGLGEATNVLVIDETLCVGCDNCEKACAETHAGISRLDRKAGATFAHVHIPVACRHCEQPHCMKDCPPNAIRRSATGEVFIDETCIGCGNCQSNCPYGVIRMEYPAPPKPGLLQWLLLGRGPGPGEHHDDGTSHGASGARKTAMKCDACISVANGPACVAACPTGAAVRVGPDEYIELVEKVRR
jgi:Fe-S-cluster-containing hydrogenase component 2/CRP-like cAMP-binding protein/thioredoxin reductase